MEHPEHRQSAPPSADAPAPDSRAAVFWRNAATGLFDRLPLPAAVCRADGTVVRANVALAAEWGTLAGPLRGRDILDLFHLETKQQLGPLLDAIRLHRRSRYPVAVRWTDAAGAERHGEMTVEPVGDTSADLPHLLLMLRAAEPAPPPEPACPLPRADVHPVEARILALTAGGATTARTAAAVGLTVDGVNYHLKRLSRRWGVTGKTALVARAYAEGLLDPGTWPPAPARSGT
ncbi:diguanylate cyclase [Streptomyces minutiscleroticus]|uniref:Uncharacterized protein n=1 Tax=Streptomyces minutiscleroticus TaxID=68238 RepID=A0A918U6E7_9ACTN|nr:diguanylate cyclase [Streptomyces minutiscleroticus]GGY00409.1 hypothetical protein GCM10010358_62730 [Streptomyces minutiscleroticus]